VNNLKFLVIHGPNLNCLGIREKGYYGDLSLSALNEKLVSLADTLNIELICAQSDSEETIVRLLQNSRGKYNGIVINPAALGHSSIAIRDALLISGLPAVEVHLSNIHKREKFRQRTTIADICIGQITGFKEQSYLLGIKALKSFLEIENNN